MTKDKRKKGCPDTDCQRNIKKVKQDADNDFCPKCGVRLVFVCAKCFDEIEDIDANHRICKKCEIEAEEKSAKRKERAKHVGVELVTAGGTVAMVVVKAFKSETTKEFGKKAADLGTKAAQAVLKTK